MVQSRNLLDSDTTWNTDQLGHRRVSLWITILNQGRCSGLLATILVLNLKLLLKHDEVTLALLELHLLLKGRAESVKGVASWDDFLTREDTDPSQSTLDYLLLFRILEVGL